jgi:hypothetical protein
MARYKLMDDFHDGEGETEVGGQRNTTKKEIEQWIIDNTKPHGGIESREGYTIKFKCADYSYIWRKISDNSRVKAK